MSEHHLIPDDTKRNYREMVLAGSTTWTDLELQFRRDGDNAGGVENLNGRGYLRLAEWAADEATKSDAGKARRDQARPGKQGDPRKATENAPTPKSPARTASGS